MKKLVNLCLAAFAFFIFNIDLKAQVASLPEKDRYIEISDPFDFFIISQIESNTIICEFELFNIFENESSKPVFVGVSELENVVDFSIKSGSERYENRRTCFLKMEKVNYLSTFNLVLDRMDVKYVLFKGELVTVKEFFALLS